MSGSSAWGAEALGWMVREGAEGGAAEGVRGPKAVIIGAVPLEEPDERIDALQKAGAGDVAGIVVSEEGEAAQRPEFAAALKDARVVFIRGGDQGRYVKGWKGTPVEAGIRAAFEGGGCVGGTSAGCAVLGEVTYSAENNSLSPEEALADARHEDLTLVRGFLGLVPGVLFDTHFTERGRVARLPVMLARARELFEDSRDVLGIGVDTRTACAVGKDGRGRIMGEGVATLLRLTERSRVVVEKGGPPTVTDVEFGQWMAGTMVEMRTGLVVERPSGVRENAHPETVEETSFEALEIDGGKEEDGGVGVLKVVMTPAESGEEASADEEPGARRAEALWSVETGSGRLPGCVVVTRAWDRGVWERLAQGIQAAAGAGGGGVGLMLWLLGEGCVMEVTKEGVARVRGDSKASAVVMDFRGARWVGGGDGPRESRPLTHVEGARLHVLGAGWGVDVRKKGEVVERV